MHLDLEEVALSTRGLSVAIVLVAFGCGGERREEAVSLPTPDESSARASPRRLDACQVPTSDMCLELGSHDIVANTALCHLFSSGVIQAGGVCAKELRIGSCRIEQDAVTAIYFGGENNDIHDSREHCEAKLRGVFTATPTKDILATWARTELRERFPGLTMLMPVGAKESLVGDEWLALELFTGYFGVMIGKSKMSVSEEKKDALDGSEYFAFDSFVTETATKIVWRVKATKDGNVGYKFALEVLAGGKEFTCESLTVFDDLELAEANMASCASIALR